MSKHPGDGSHYTAEESAVFRELLQKLQQDRGWTQTALAKHLEVSQQTISAFVNGKSAGVVLVRALERVTGRTAAEMLGRAGAPEGRLRWSQLPGWERSVQEAKGQYRAPDWAYQKIGERYWDGPAVEVSPAVVGGLAVAWWQTAGKEEVADAVETQTRAQIAEQQAKRSNRRQGAGAAKPVTPPAQENRADSGN